MTSITGGLHVLNQNLTSAYVPLDRKRKYTLMYLHTLSYVHIHEDSKRESESERERQ